MLIRRCGPGLPDNIYEYKGSKGTGQEQKPIISRGDGGGISAKRPIGGGALGRFDSFLPAPPRAVRSSYKLPGGLPSGAAHRQGNRTYQVESLRGQFPPSMALGGHRMPGPTVN